MTQSSRRAAFRDTVRARGLFSATFQKTPAYEVVEVMAHSGLHTMCIDTEHAAFDRARLDACLAIGRALDFPLLVRVPSSDPACMLQALDSGADGVIVPHVDSPEKAAAVAKAARFGRGGRGFAGSTRSAGFATRSMGAVLAETADTLVVVQIEDIEGVDTCEAICATPGIDAVFLGPADLSVAYGHANQDNPDLMAAIARVGAAAEANGLGYFTYVPNAEKAKAWQVHGFTGFFIASDHAWMLQGARAQAAAIAQL